MKKGLGNLLQSLSNKSWIEQAIEEGSNKQEKTFEFTGRFSPSQAGDCPRLIQLSMFGLVHKGIDPKGQRIFDNGDFVHLRYAEYFKKASRLEQEEAKFRFQHRDVTISGRADIVVKDYQDKKYIGEMKSINDRRFTEVLLANAPLEEHLLQWNLYSFGLNIQDGFILYENKNDQRLLAFSVQFDNNLFDQVINKFCFINDCIKKNTLVPRPEPCPNSYFCAAKFTCKEDNKTKELLSYKITEFMTKKLEK